MTYIRHHCKARQTNIPSRRYFTRSATDTNSFYLVLMFPCHSGGAAVAILQIGHWTQTLAPREQIHIDLTFIFRTSQCYYLPFNAIYCFWHHIIVNHARRHARLTQRRERSRSTECIFDRHTRRYVISFH